MFDVFFTGGTWDIEPPPRSVRDEAPRTRAAAPARERSAATRPPAKPDPAEGLLAWAKG